VLSNNQQTTSLPHRVSLQSRPKAGARPSAITTSSSMARMGNPRYPLDLLLRAIAVSLETVQIVDSLPALDID